MNNNRLREEVRKMKLLSSLGIQQTIDAVFEANEFLYIAICLSELKNRGEIELCEAIRKATLAACGFGQIDQKPTE